MLRITTQQTNQSVRLVLEGKLRGAWVAELEQAFTNGKSTSVGRAMVVDLSGLTGTDAAGRHLLTLMQGQGATLDNSSPLFTALLSPAAQ